MSTAPPISNPFLNDAITQIDGSAYAMKNCVIAVVVGLIRVASLGYWKISCAAFRTATGDTSGGITYDTAVATASRKTSGQVKLARLYWAPPSTLRDLMVKRVAAGLSIWTARLRGTPWALSGSFGHTIEIGGIFTDSAGVERAWVMDPGHSDAQWEAWPLSLVLGCAKDRTGNGTIHVIYTRDLTNVDRAVLSDGVVRDAPNGTAPIVGKVAAGTTVRVTTTVRGAAWDTGRGYTARGWSKLGDKRYVMGKRVR